MYYIKDNFDLIKPKYVDNDTPLFVYSTHITYRIDNEVTIHNVKPFNVDKENSIIKITNVTKVINDIEYITMNETLKEEAPFSWISNLTKNEILFTKEMFDFCNAIVSCGLSPMDMGTIKCRNGILEIRYFNLEYSISGTFNIPNKTLVIDSYINFNIIWYLYVFYREYSTKKEAFIINFCPSTTGYIINYNTFYVVFNSTRFPAKLIDSMYVSYNRMMDDNAGKKCDILTKKFIGENNVSIYKNVIKAFGDEIGLIREQVYDVLKNANLNAVIVRINE